MLSKMYLIVALLAVGGCGEANSQKTELADLETLVKNAPIGGDSDYWIEMENSLGDWERTGLIFGYYGDGEECQKAIAGLAKENFERNYRCTRAN